MRDDFPHSPLTKVYTNWTIYEVLVEEGDLRGSEGIIKVFILLEEYLMRLGLVYLSSS